ncbi:hypothetical protein C8034_v012226 [Colletotrichum sidae]|uniref:Uncharacterized protein n=2 Tax=Colletotrichum orbiculare species complex TaxID=2707354 RepID=A0A4R8Q827_9PEZI|nr:hypothetical protein C8035_v002590 [Colletotrichum spinosum]TEA17807.1 hypothetical protein C8034_v012226 [Colletotrichum sidae]
MLVAKIFSLTALLVSTVAAVPADSYAGTNPLAADLTKRAFRDIGECGSVKHCIGCCMSGACCTEASCGCR